MSEDVLIPESHRFHELTRLRDLPGPQGPRPGPRAQVASCVALSCVALSCVTSWLLVEKECADIDALGAESSRSKPHDPADPDDPSQHESHGSVDSAPHYPGTDSTYAEWQDYYNMLLLKIKRYMDNHQAGKALFFIMTKLELFFQDYDEDHKMDGAAKFEKILTELLHLKNRVSSDFNKEKDGPNDEAAKDALVCYFGGTLSDGTHTDGIKAILEECGPKGKKMFDQDFISDVEQAFEGKDNPIFHGNVKGDDKALAKYWHGLWEDQTKKSASGSVQPVVNAIQNVESEFSNQSSIIQAQLKLDEADDEQYQAITHDGMGAFVGLIKQVNSNMQSSA